MRRALEKANKRKLKYKTKCQPSNESLLQTHTIRYTVSQSVISVIFVCDRHYSLG